MAMFHDEKICTYLRTIEVPTGQAVEEIGKPRTKRNGKAHGDAAIPQGKMHVSEKVHVDPTPKFREFIESAKLTSSELHVC